MFQPKSVNTTDLGFISYCFATSTRPTPPNLSALWNLCSWFILNNTPNLQSLTPPLSPAPVPHHPNPLHCTPIWGHPSTWTLSGSRWSSSVLHFTPFPLLLLCPPHPLSRLSPQCCLLKCVPQSPLGSSLPPT